MSKIIDMLQQYEISLMVIKDNKFSETAKHDINNLQIDYICIEKYYSLYVCHLIYDL